MEFGYETIDADIKTQYSTSNFEDVSWMLTKDLDIAEVKWVVQYKITNPNKYLWPYTSNNFIVYWRNI